MPSLQEQAIKMTREGIDMLFRTAKFVPEDKRTDWVPMGAARTTQDQLIEIALSPYFFVPLLKGEPLDPGASADREAAAAALTTLEAAEAKALESHELLYAAIAGMTESEMSEELTLPWGKATKADTMLMPYWNVVYHIGQISYIQLMLGDTDMH